jgi:hypothetical protein
MPLNIYSGDEMGVYLEPTYLELHNGIPRLTHHALVTLTRAWLEDKGYGFAEEGMPGSDLGDLTAWLPSEEVIFKFFVTSEEEAFATWLKLLGDSRLCLAVTCAIPLPIRFAVIVWKRDRASGKMIPICHRLSYADFTHLEWQDWEDNDESERA